MTELLHFLLVPDKAAARRVRRALATRGACTGTVVGTWAELIDQARRAYLLPPVDPDWELLLAEAMRRVKGGFWSVSYESDPEGTLEVLGRELERLLRALGPGKPFEPVRKTSLSDRGKKHLSDLSRLYEEMGRALPPGLDAIRDLLAALYASPLMPWDVQAGNRLATQIMDGEFDPDPPEGASPAAERMIALIREKHETVKGVKDALAEFETLLDSSGSMERHVEEACSALALLEAALENIKGKEVPWEELSKLIPQAPVSSGAHAEFTREGAAVFREGEEPWRPVRLLFVLGFSEGRYPAGPERSPVFDDRDVATLKNDHGYALETAQEGMARRRALFERQIRSAADQAVFLSPLRDPLGEEIALCGTIAFMTRLFDKMVKPEDLVLTLERESHRTRAAGIALAPPTPPVPLRLLEIKDPDLGEDLFSDGRGGTRRETPSSLDTLLVSPLSWFLDRNKLLPLDWAPEELEPMTKGTLAHAVFERLFPAGGPLPTPAQIRSGTEKLLDEAILNTAPFLQTSEWFVERRNLPLPADAQRQRRDSGARRRCPLPATQGGGRGRGPLLHDGRPAVAHRPAGMDSQKRPGGRVSR